MNTNEVKTMSSLEIAELTGKRHDNVMTDIRNMLEELYEEKGLLRFQDTYTNSQNNQVYKCFNLPKHETLVLVAGYSIKLRSKIIKRWEELEEQTKKPLTQIEIILASAQILADVEKRLTATEQVQQTVLNMIEDHGDKFEGIESDLEDFKNTSMILPKCPTAAENLTTIRKRMNEKYGLSAATVDAVLRNSPYTPKAAGMVRNEHKDAGGNTYPVYWIKDITALFKRFVVECEAVSAGRYTHPFIENKFKITTN